MKRRELPWIRELGRPRIIMRHAGRKRAGKDIVRMMGLGAGGLLYGIIANMVVVGGAIFGSPQEET